MKRQLNLRDPLTNKEITEFLFREDTDDINNCLVINGGPGLGKTKQTMKSIKQALTLKNGKSPRMLVVESRSITVEQIGNTYTEEIEGIGGITIKQRIAFMNMIKSGEVEQYDWVIIDECHGLFSEASFAEDASYIANWIRCGRTHQHVIFITANDEYFSDVFKNYFPSEFTYSQLFDDPTKYNSATYVKSAKCIITSLTIQRIESLMPRFRGKKGIMFFPRASLLWHWYKEFSKMGINCFPMVSLKNSTALEIADEEKQWFKYLQLDESHGDSGLTMADLEESLDIERIKNGKPGVRASLNSSASLPDDIEILLTTDTLQEGVSIISHIDYILIEGYTEVEVRQKLGRYRGNLDELYIIINRGLAKRQINRDKEIFDKLFALQEEDNQIQLAMQYAFFEGQRWKKKYIIMDKENHFCVNQAAYEHFLRTSNKFLSYDNFSLVPYAHDLLDVYVKNPKTDVEIIENKDFHNFNLKTIIQPVLEKWAGIPLKGTAQEELLDDLAEVGIMDERGRPIDTFRKCTNIFKKVGVELKEKQATEKDLKCWPDYLSKLREKYKVFSF